MEALGASLARADAGAAVSDERDAEGASRRDRRHSSGARTWASRPS